MLGGRPVSMVLREAFGVRNYAAVARALRVYVNPVDGIWRYLRGRGSYPYRCRLRTPTGRVAPTLHHPHDIWTVHEIFCREDYRTGVDLRVVVDIGSNIGLSALFFLTRSPLVRCRLYEPVPANAERLEANLSQFAERFTLERAAVADRAGTVTFGVEPSGRYGGIGVELSDLIEVPCLDVNDVLEAAFAAEGRVDVLKLDTEGAELATVRAIAPEHLRRIGAIVLEVERPATIHPELFVARFANQTLRLERRVPARA